MKQFVAQPGQTTNDSTVPENEKEEARSRRAQNKKEAHGTYSGASALKRSTCRGMCCVVKQLVSQKSQVMRVNRLQPLTSRLPESGLGVSKRAAMAKGHHNLRADRQATTALSQSEHLWK